MQNEWENEPDKEQFYHRDVPCLIVRGPLGALCGYAGVYPSHPWYEKDYNNIDINVHGGLTYSAPCAEDGGKICHVPKEDEQPVWWFGFDCAHGGDYCPKYYGDDDAKKYYSLSLDDGIYRNINYVRNCIKDMADQILSSYRSF